MGNLSNDQLSGLGVNEAAAFTPDAVGGIKKDQIAAIDPTAVAGFGEEQVAAFDPTAVAGFDKDQVAGFNPTALAGFVKDQVAEFVPEAVAGFVKDQVAEFVPEAVAGFAKEQVAAFVPEAVAGFAKEQLAAFVPEAVAGFAKEQLAAFVPEAVAGFAKEQVAAFVPEAVAGFAKEQVASLDPTAVAGFAKDQVASFDPLAMEGFDPTHVAAFDAEAMAGFKGPTLKELDPESFDAVTDEQLAEMAPDAAAAVKNWVLPPDDVILWEGGLRGPDGEFMSAETYFDKRTTGDKPTEITIFTPPEIGDIAKSGGFTKADGTFVDEEDYFKDPASAGWTAPPDAVIKKDGGFRNPNGKWVTAKDFLAITGDVPETDEIKKNGGYFDADKNWVSSVAHFGEGSADAQTVAWTPPAATAITTDGGFWDPFGQWVKAEVFETEGWTAPEAAVESQIPEGITEEELKEEGGYVDSNGTRVTDASFFDTSLDNEVNKTAGYWGATTDPIAAGADPTAVELDSKPISEVVYPWQNIEGLNISTDSVIESAKLATFSVKSVTDTTETHWASLIKSKDDGDDRLVGGETSDNIFGGLGSDFIDGGDGEDVAFYAGNFADYEFDRTKDTVSINDQRDGLNDGNDTLKNVEYVQFADQKVDVSKLDILKTYEGNSKDFKFFKRNDGSIEIKTDDGFDDITGIPKLEFDDKTFSGIGDIEDTFDQVTSKDDSTGQMFRVYNAAFARFPDSDGLEYWIDKHSSGVDDSRAVASSFLVSPEFKATYGENVSNEKYVENLYTNVLARDYDQEGYNYWVGNLNTGIETRYELLLGFSESLENKALFSEMTGLF